MEDVLGALKALGVSYGYDSYVKWRRTLKVGLIVNPIAGMGGAVGLKGTDGEAYKKALIRGAKPIAPRKAYSFLSLVKPISKAIELLSFSGLMGEVEAKQAGLYVNVLKNVSEETTAEDTKEAASLMIDEGADVLVFVGGDGTARDIFDAVKGKSIPVIGVPSGVKMYSSIFAVNVLAAADLFIDYVRFDLPCEEREIVDVDEEAFRRGVLSVKHYGYLRTPVKDGVLQAVKMPSSSCDKEEQLKIAKFVAKNMEKDVVYVVGPGLTTYALAEVLGFDKTLLGVDVVLNGKTIAKDADEGTILSLIRGKKAKIIVTPIGGQGFIFGRGNQQISPNVIKLVGKGNIIVLATKNKIKHIDALRVDTGDAEVDAMLRGSIEVIVGYGEKTLMDIV